jgi:hypothetical protein
VSVAEVADAQRLGDAIAAIAAIAARSPASRTAERLAGHGCT